MAKANAIWMPRGLDHSSSNMNTLMKTGLIIEDIPEAQVWLSGALSIAFPEIVIHIASDIKRAHKLLEKISPDIALVDLSLPDGDGSRLVPLIKARAPHSMVVIATIYYDDEHLYSALRAGADGYLLKEEGKDHLAAALLRIGKGHPPLSPQIAQRLVRHFRPPEGEKTQPLSPREEDVLRLIAKGYTLAEVSTQLKLSQNTVATHVKRIYLKLHISSRSEATIEATKRGMISTTF